MQHIGQQQFLVLLFMLQADLQQGGQVGVNLGIAQQHGHTFIDRRAIAQHLGQAGACDQAALRTRVLLAHALVAAVDEHAVGAVVRAKARLEALQHKGLEEPGHMGQMPFDGAGVGHGLHLAIGLGQRCRQCQRARAQLGITRGQRAGQTFGCGGP